jgi:glutathione S-transferase
MRKLIFTTGSPFARAVRIVLDEKGLEWEPQEEITTPSVEARAKASPTLQVPTFVEGELRLWDSSVILDYLTTSYPSRDIAGTALRYADEFIRADHEWVDKLAMATLQTLGVSTTVISQLQWAGVKHEDNGYATRCAARIQHILDWSESVLVSEDEGFVPGILSAQDVLLAVMIMFMENRPLRLIWRSPERRKMAALHERAQSRPSFVQNPILWWEPGVVGYEGETPIYAPESRPERQLSGPG